LDKILEITNEIIEPSVEIINPLNGDKICIDIERAGRTCYKSDDREFTPETGRKSVEC